MVRLLPPNHLMNFHEFERHARQVWAEIPSRFREGVDGLVVEQAARPHPTLAEIYTLGECVTESYPSEFGGPETIRSVVVLYHGSFVRLAALDPDFDWRFEVWETLTHELRHHLESLADEVALDRQDYAADENFKRLEGEPFDLAFYRAGEPVAPGVWQIEREVFVEVGYDDDAPPPRVGFEWHGRRHSVRVPSAPGDACFIQIVDGVDTGAAELCVVLVRRRGWLAALRSWLARERPRVVQLEAAATPVDDAEGAG